MGHEPLGKFWLVVEKANHGCFLDPHDCGCLHCCGCRHAPGLPGQASLAAEIAGSEDCNDRFFPLLGNHGELHFAALDVENRIRRLPLRKDNFTYFIGGYRPSAVCLCEEGLGVEQGFLLALLCSTFRAESSRKNVANRSIIRSSRTSHLNVTEAPADPNKSGMAGPGHR